MIQKKTKKGQIHLTIKIKKMKIIATAHKLQQPFLKCCKRLKKFKMKKRELNKNKTSKNTLFLKPKMATIKHPQS
jgi:hypothetical protein